MFFISFFKYIYIYNGVNLPSRFTQSIKEKKKEDACLSLLCPHPFCFPFTFFLFSPHLIPPFSVQCAFVFFFSFRLTFFHRVSLFFPSSSTLPTAWPSSLSPPPPFSVYLPAAAPFHFVSRSRFVRNMGLPFPLFSLSQRKERLKETELKKIKPSCVTHFPSYSFLYFRFIDTNHLHRFPPTLFSFLHKPLTSFLFLIYFFFFLPVRFGE